MNKDIIFFQFLNMKCSKVVQHFIKVSENRTTQNKVRGRSVTLNCSMEITVELSLDDGTRLYLFLCYIIVHKSNSTLLVFVDNFKSLLQEKNIITVTNIFHNSKFAYTVRRFVEL